MQQRNVVAFRNRVQKALWDCELTGQISDGNWENARPYDHWVSWCRAASIVDPENVGREGFYPLKENYNFVSRDLLEVIGTRMLVIARLAVIGLTSKQIRTLESCFVTVSGSAAVDEGEIRWRIPSWWEASETTEPLRMRLENMDVERAKEAVFEGTMMPDDLRELLHRNYGLGKYDVQKIQIDVPRLRLAVAGFSPEDVDFLRPCFIPEGDGWKWKTIDAYKRGDELVAEKLAGVDVEAVKRAVIQGSFTFKQLKDELRDMKKIIRTKRE